MVGFLNIRLVKKTYVPLTIQHMHTHTHKIHTHGYTSFGGILCTHYVVRIVKYALQRILNYFYYYCLLLNLLKLKI